MKHPATPQTHRYTTLRNINVKKQKQPKAYNVIYDVLQDIQ